MGETTGLPVSIERFKSQRAPMRADARFDGIPPAAADRKDAPQTVSYQGVMVPVERDRLEIVMEMGAEPVFPLDRMPVLFRDMVEAAQQDVLPKGEARAAIPGGKSAQTALSEARAFVKANPGLRPQVEQQLRSWGIDPSRVDQ